jgi:glutamate dehydrogenase
VPWRIVTVLRAYCRYLLQTGLPFSQGYIAQVLVNNAAIARLLADLFAARFDPDVAAPARRAALARIDSASARRARTGHPLGRGPHPARPLECLSATVRTNAYQRTAERSAQGIPVLQDREPAAARTAAAEAAVRSIRVLAAHGRRAPAHGLRRARRHPLVRPARGFRTEILGLMKAQHVKNTVIVPVGAKGGFVVRRRPATARRSRPRSSPAIRR